MMELYFDVRKLSTPSIEFIAWLDVMGIKPVMERSIKISANFVYKLHIAALEAPSDNLKIYPIMDGLYCSAQNQEDMEKFLKTVFSKLTKLFIDEEKEHFRFIIRGAIAKGAVYHGCNLDDEAAHTLAENERYRDKIMLGLPMIQAYLGEKNAPLFLLGILEKEQEVKTTFGGGSSGFQCKKIRHVRSDIEDLLDLPLSIL